MSGSELCGIVCCVCIAGVLVWGFYIGILWLCVLFNCRMLLYIVADRVVVRGCMLLGACYAIACKGCVILCMCCALKLFWACFALWVFVGFCGFLCYIMFVVVELCCGIALRCWLCCVALRCVL